MPRPSSLLVPFVLFAACSDSNVRSRPNLDVPDACDDAVPPTYAPATVQSCRGEPVVGAFEPVVGWQWRENSTHRGYHQIMAAPVVAHLNDDDNNGVIGDGDVPDVVFTAFAGSAYGSPGALVALDGATGAQIWSISQAGGAKPYGAAGVAVADLGPGGPVVLVPSDKGLLAVEGGNGAFRWLAATQVYKYGHPSVADVDGDGVAEVVFGASLINFDGTVRWTGEGGQGRPMRGSFAVDLDGDGLAEIVAGNTVYEVDGSIRWQADGPDLWPAVGDLDLDGSPEIIGTDGVGNVVVRNADGSDRWTFTLADGGGGPPTVADFDGDGLPEIGVASRSVYRVIDGDGTELWANTVQDYSSQQTGSSVFDFEGDGAAEVVYADEQTLWVWDGATGEVELKWTDHASGTLFEYPLVVDVDADGAAEIVLASNNYSRPGAQGITVIEDASDSWAAARTVWNQHAWCIVNANDDGTVPPGAPGNWSKWNSFRSGNSQTSVGLGQPDLAVGVADTCSERCEFADIAEVFVSIENRGLDRAEGFWVSIKPVEGAERLLLERVDGLAAGSAVWLGPISLTQEQLDLGVEVIVDEEGEVKECDEDNNHALLPSTLGC